MVFFILFPGFADPLITWEYADENTHIDFLDQIKQIGKTFTYVPLYHNVNHYDNNKLLPSKLYDRDINFDLAYLDLKKHCKMIYDKVKALTNDKFVLISHSVGNLYAYYFSLLYTDECLFSIVLDGRLLGQVGIDVEKDRLEKYRLKYKNITDNDLHNLQQKIINNKDNRKEIDELIDIVSMILLEQLPKINKFPIKTIYFRNLDIHETYSSKEKEQDKKTNNLLKIKEIDEYKKNDDKFEIVWFVNKTHWPFAYKECSNVIIEKIKSLLVKHNQKGGINYYQKYYKYKNKYMQLK